MAAVTLSSCLHQVPDRHPPELWGVWWGWWFLGNRIEDASITPHHVGGGSLLCVW